LKSSVVESEPVSWEFLEGARPEAGSSQKIYREPKPLNLFRERDGKNP
jgi:hypothetical protein